MIPHPTPQKTAPFPKLPAPECTPEGVPIPNFTPWRPKRERAGGWSAAVQRAFIAELTRINSVAAAAKAVGKSVRSAYQLRDKPGAESFAAAWDAARARCRDAAYAVAVNRALHGEIVPIYRRGQFWGFRIEQNDKMLMAALKAGGASDAELAERHAALERWEAQLRRMQIGLEGGGVDSGADSKTLAEAEEDHRVWQREMEREQRRQRNAEIRAAVRKGMAPLRPPGPRVRML